MKFLAKNDTIFGIDICVDDASRPFYCAENGTSLSIRELNDRVFTYLSELPRDHRFPDDNPVESVAARVVLIVRNENNRFKVFNVSSSESNSSKGQSSFLTPDSMHTFAPRNHRFVITEDGDFIHPNTVIPERVAETLSTCAIQ